MTLNARVEIGRPIAAMLILLAGLLLGSTLLASTLAGLWSATAERDAKAEFMSRSLAAGRHAGIGPEREPLSVVAETETLAAARTDDLLRSTARDAGAAVLSSRAEAKPDAPGPHRRIEVEAVVEGKIEALQTLLYRLETGTPMILVDAFAMQPSDTAAPGADPRAPLLRATMTLSAFWAKPVR